MCISNRQANRKSLRYCRYLLTRLFFAATFCRTFAICSELGFIKLNIYYHVLNNKHNINTESLFVYFGFCRMEQKAEVINNGQFTLFHFCRLR